MATLPGTTAGGPAACDSAAQQQGAGPGTLPAACTWSNRPTVEVLLGPAAATWQDRPMNTPDELLTALSSACALKDRLMDPLQHVRAPATAEPPTQQQRGSGSDGMAAGGAAATLRQAPGAQPAGHRPCSSAVANVELSLSLMRLLQVTGYQVVEGWRSCLQSMPHCTANGQWQ